MTKKTFFKNCGRTVTASAPGRLDVMGGIADYSGSLVLEMPIRERTRVTAARTSDGRIRVWSSAVRPGKDEPLVNIPADALTDKKRNADIQSLQRVTNGKSAWARYIIGTMAVLLREKRSPVKGTAFYVETGIPPGKGVSSSAALEVAAMQAYTDLCGIRLKGTELPRFCQMVENEVVGAPCGLMDQLASYHGVKDALLPILCRPDILKEPIPVPAGLAFTGIDSGVRHAVGGSSYGDVRTAAFMGYTIIARSLGISRSRLASARKSGTAKGLPYGGFLTNISPSELNERFAPLLPVKLKGADFNKNFGQIIDPVTDVVRDKKYPVAAAAAHPVQEHYRVQLFRHMLTSVPLRRGITRTDHLAALGELMYQSHTSYGMCGLGNKVTDAIAAEARKSGPAGGIYGARITGGGSGGVVCIMHEKSQIARVRQIADAIARQFETETTIFSGSSAGAAIQ